MTKADRSKISDQQSAAILALLAGKTTEEAAAAAGVARQTVSQWRNHDEDFRNAYHAARGDLLETCLDRLRCSALRAVEILAADLESDDAAARRASARLILSTVAQLKTYVTETGAVGFSNMLSTLWQ